MLDFTDKWCHIVFVFFFWLTSFSMTIPRCIHVAANAIITLSFKAEQYCFVFKYNIFFIHASVSGHLDHFLILTIANSAAVTILI